MEEGENMPIKKVNHIAIAVKDMDEAIPFYRDILRLPYHGTQLRGGGGLQSLACFCLWRQKELVPGIKDFAGCQQIYREEGGRPIPYCV